MNSETPVNPAGRSKGCLVALGVAAVLALMACLGVGGVLFTLSDNPLVKEAAAKRSHRTTAVMQAMNAPGTAELRELGCAQALVVQGAELAELVRDLVDAGQPGDVERVKVVCRSEAAVAPPRCDLVAKTWATAARPPRGFLVSSISASERCDGRYDASGAREP